jgi:hypothetical protein
MLGKLGELVNGKYRIVSQPPTIVPARDLETMYGLSAEQVEDVVHREFRPYRSTLQEDRRQLLERFEIIDMARKVVGVGSVGTQAFHRPAARPRRTRPAVPAGQGGHRLGARVAPAQEPVPAARRAGRAGSAADASR